MSSEGYIGEIDRVLRSGSDLPKQLLNHLAAIHKLDRPTNPADVFVVGVDVEGVIDRAEEVRRDLSLAFA